MPVKVTREGKKLTLGKQLPIYVKKATESQKHAEMKYKLASSEWKKIKPKVKQLTGDFDNTFSDLQKDMKFIALKIHYLKECENHLAGIAQRYDLAEKGVDGHGKKLKDKDKAKMIKEADNMIADEEKRSMLLYRQINDALSEMREKATAFHEAASDLNQVLSRL